jgi:hypothetical protein
MSEASLTIFTPRCGAVVEPLGFYRGSTTSAKAPKTQQRGEIETLPSGSLRETTGTLFVSDVLAHGGPCAAMTDRDVVGPALDVLRAYPEVIPLSGRTFAILARMTGLAPSTLAIHHGAAYTGDTSQALTESARSSRPAPAPTWTRHSRCPKPWPADAGRGSGAVGAEKSSRAIWGALS